SPPEAWMGPGERRTRAREARKEVTMNTRISAILAGALSAMAFPLAVTSAEKPKILVGPNILVSRDGNFHHVALMVAANPRNGKHLVGAAITEEIGRASCR